MKKILISIKPEWVKKILNGEKTIEVRRTAPKCELPCEVYIYCTKGKPSISPFLFYENNLPPHIVGDEINGKVVAKFTLNKVEAICCEGLENGCGGHNYFYSLEDGEDIRKKACLDEFDLRNYLGTKLDGDEVGYAWHIDDLVIFDKPRKLGEFDKQGSYLNPSIKCPKKDKGKCNEGISPFTGKWCGCEKARLTHAPQSWCYCEVDE